MGQKNLSYFPFQMHAITFSTEFFIFILICVYVYHSAAFLDLFVSKNCKTLTAIFWECISICTSFTKQIVRTVPTRSVHSNDKFKLLYLWYEDWVMCHWGIFVFVTDVLKVIACRHKSFVFCVHVAVECWVASICCCHHKGTVVNRWTWACKDSLFNVANTTPASNQTSSFGMDTQRRTQGRSSSHIIKPLNLPFGSNLNSSTTTLCYTEIMLLIMLIENHAFMITWEILCFIWHWKCVV